LLRERRQNYCDGNSWRPTKSFLKQRFRRSEKNSSPNLGALRNHDNKSRPGSLFLLRDRKQNYWGCKFPENHEKSFSSKKIQKKKKR